MPTATLRRAAAALAAAALVTSGAYAVPAAADSPGNTDTTVTDSPDTVYGQNAAFTAQVVRNDGSTVKPQGLVTFSEGGTTLATKTLGSGGKAVFTTSKLAIGNHEITATYAGDGTADPSSGSTFHYVDVPDSVSTIDDGGGGSIAYGTPITATVTIAKPGKGPAPEGWADWFDDGNYVTETLVHHGRTTLPGTFLEPGGHNLAFSFTGTANPSGTQNVHFDVTKGASATSLTSSADPSDPGQTVTFRATVTTTSGLVPTGDVVFSIDGNPVATVPLNSRGRAAYPTSALPSGGHPVLATYAGDSHYTGSSASLNQIVRAGTT